MYALIKVLCFLQQMLINFYLLPTFAGLLWHWQFLLMHGRPCSASLSSCLLSVVISLPNCTTLPTVYACTKDLLCTQTYFIPTYSILCKKFYFASLVYSVFHCSYFLKVPLLATTELQAAWRQPRASALRSRTASLIPDHQW